MKRFAALLLTFVFLFLGVSCRNDEALDLACVSSSVSESSSLPITEAAAQTEGETPSVSAKTSLTNKEETKPSLVSAVKTTVTEILTALETTTAKRTKVSTTRKNYFAKTSSTAWATEASVKTETQTTRAEKTTTEKAETTQKTAPTTASVTRPAKLYCTISIDCYNVLKNQDKLKEEKKPFVPTNGKILNSVKVEFKKGETVFDVFKRACSENVCSDNCSYCQKTGILFEYEYTPGYGNYYIEGIHQIYEKDCGSKSGWMYKVNGVFANEGCSTYVLNDGDVIEWVYTCDLGEDVGAEV